MHNKKEIGKLLKEKRIKLGLSQTEAARKLGLKKPQGLCNIENGLSGSNFRVLKKARKLYGIPVSKFIKLFSQEIKRSIT